MADTHLDIILSSGLPDESRWPLNDTIDHRLKGNPSTSARIAFQCEGVDLHESTNEIAGDTAQFHGGGEREHATAS